MVFLKSFLLVIGLATAFCSGRLFGADEVEVPMFRIKPKQPIASLREMCKRLAINSSVIECAEVAGLREILMLEVIEGLRVMLNNARCICASSEVPEGADARAQLLDYEASIADALHSLTVEQLKFLIRVSRASWKAGHKYVVFAPEDRLLFESLPDCFKHRRLFMQYGLQPKKSIKCVIQ